MIAISRRPIGRDWGTIRFASTLYLCPILDLLLAQIPVRWQAELRLGLQEALVNAARHGNNLDPGKTVSVRFSVVDGHYWWVISDEGSGFSPPSHDNNDAESAQYLPPQEAESGRGMCILHEIFDQVHWHSQGQGTELRLCKEVSSKRRRQPLVR